MTREQMIAELKKIKPSYNYNRYEDAQIYRMYQKYVIDKAPRKDVVTQQNTIGEIEKSISDYEAERELHVGYKTCDNCGTRLNDMGTCPRCDEGEEELIESLSANEYQFIYYDNDAGRDRRPETIEDVEDGWHEVTFRADSDLDAWKHVFEEVKGYEWTDYFLDENPLENTFLTYFETEADWSDGSPILIKLSSKDNVLYDSGYTKDSWIEEFVGDNSTDLDDLSEKDYSGFASYEFPSETFEVVEKYDPLNNCSLTTDIETDDQM